MRRRRFLQRAGLAVAGGAGAIAARPASPLVAAEPAAGTVPEENPRPRVLVTAAELPLAQSLGEGLAGRWQVHLTARADVATDLPCTRCELAADACTRELVRGISSLVHVALAPAGLELAEAIDRLVRGTYDLLTAAAAAGVGRAVLISSLQVMSGYGDAFQVAEDWQPRPAAESAAMAEYLAECVGREFARQRKLEVVVLRIGKAVRAEAVAGQAFDPWWVDQRDVLQAVSAALAAKQISFPRGTEGWAVFHILSDSAGARFSVNKAQAGLGYRPQYRW
ncbi:MAG: hypothetical protein GX575_05155 [Candidatus Anammoximicrobium sp.]|nr:hypothetical protein [Candidatus Anammoximicrobium sp.]